MRKTDRDIAREAKAHAMNGELLAAGIHHVRVVAGGKGGPYSLISDRLSERDCRWLVRALIMRMGGFLGSDT